MTTCNTWKTTAARQTMTFTRVEHAKITDSVLNIQSARASLEDLDGGKIAKLVDIQNCLKHADETLRSALRNPGSKQPS